MFWFAGVVAIGTYAGFVVFAVRVGFGFSRDFALLMWFVWWEQLVGVVFCLWVVLGDLF